MSFQFEGEFLGAGGRGRRKGEGGGRGRCSFNL